MKVSEVTNQMDLTQSKNVISYKYDHNCNPWNILDGGVKFMFSCISSLDELESSILNLIHLINLPRINISAPFTNMV